MSTPTFRDTVRDLLRDRLLDAAHTITIDDGWAAVTMGKVAEAAGVSRQTVYNEFGNKHDLAQALVLRELATFLDVVAEQLRAQNNLVEGLGSACEAALRYAEDNPLLKAAIGSVHSGSNELIPLLTTESQFVIDTAVAAVVAVVDEHYGEIGLSPDEITLSADLIVRLVLSHIMRPGVPAHEMGEQVRWIASKILGA